MLKFLIFFVLFLTWFVPQMRIYEYKMPSMAGWPPESWISAVLALIYFLYLVVRPEKEEYSEEEYSSECDDSVYVNEVLFGNNRNTPVKDWSSDWRS